MKTFPYLWAARALAHPHFTTFDYIVFATLTITFFFTWRTLWRISRLLAIVFSRLLIALFLSVIVQGFLFVTGPYQKIRELGGSFGAGLNHTVKEL